MKSRFAVTAILQCFNAESYLQDWLDHVSCFASQVIVLDDGSTDATSGILQSSKVITHLITRDSYRKTAWSELANRQILLAEAGAAGADWVFSIDVDERLERDAANCLEKIIEEAEHDGRTVVSFRLREIWDNANTFRVDGIWGEKRKASLFKFDWQSHDHDTMNLHGEWYSVTTHVDKILNLELNLYHLKMLERSDRIARAQRYKELDPNNEYQTIGYDYLIDETNIRLEAIPEQRMYDPLPKSHIRRNSQT